MLDGIQLDPYTVLGLERDATPQQVRDAFRQKSKKYHPDQGGDEWAFRVVVRAYELLGEGRGPSAPAIPNATPIFPGGPAAANYDGGQVRQGVIDKGIDPSKIVYVEIIWMRYEVNDVLDLLRVSPKDRNLSGTMHITWPGPSGHSPTMKAGEKANVLNQLQVSVEAMRSKTNVVAAQVTADVERFEAWLSYASGSEAWDAFRTLHVGLKFRGLGVHQWTRDLTVPRPGS